MLLGLPQTKSDSSWFFWQSQTAQNQFRETWEVFAFATFVSSCGPLVQWSVRWSAGQIVPLVRCPWSFRTSPVGRGEIRHCLFQPVSTRKGRNKTLSIPARTTYSTTSPIIPNAVPDSVCAEKRCIISVRAREATWRSCPDNQPGS